MINKSLWNNQVVICLTFDLDWASEDSIKHTVDIIEKFGFKSTFFITHSSKILSNKIKNKEIDTGIHPNFLKNSSHGSNPKEIIDYCTKLLPEANSFRCHKYFDNNDITELLFDKGFKYDSNLCTNLECVDPFIHRSGLIRFPIYFEDGCYRKFVSLIEEPLIIKKYEQPLTYYYSDIIDSLSDNMKLGLIDIIIGDNKLVIKTLKALTKRKLINENILTHDGWVIAISLLSLDKQCDLLGIEYEQIRHHLINKPEESILDFYQKKNFHGFFSEGKILFQIMKSIIISVLYPKSKHLFKYEDSLRLNLRCLHLNAKFKHEVFLEILEAFKYINKEMFIYYFNLLKSVESQIIFDTPPTRMDFGQNLDYINYDTDHAYLLYIKMGHEIFVEIFSRLNKNELDLIGWPDLIVFNEDDYCFIEVKKKDKLIPSQIRTIPKLKSLGLKIKVNRIFLEEKKIN